MTPLTPPTHYEILGLPSTLQNEHSLPAQILRAAYRRALLQWHPDKSHPTLNSKREEHGKYSVDQISTAYAVLGDVKRRGEYDKEVQAQRLLKGEVGENRKFKTGVEVVDLDDLSYDEAQEVWYRGCRCGDNRGFEVREEDLEEGQGDGEVVVGCKGCSLWLRVLFGVVEDEDAEGLDRKVGHNGI